MMVPIFDHKHTLVSRSRICAAVALLTATSTAGQLVTKAVDNSVNTLFTRAHTAWPLRQEDFDDATLGKPGQFVMPRGASLFPRLSFHQSPSFTPFLYSQSGPSADCTSSWASYSLHSCAQVSFSPKMQATVGHNVQAMASTQEMPPPGPTRQDLDLSIPTMLKDEGVGIAGRWKEVAGNFVSYPPDIESNPPRGIIHFLGGAFVGAAPHFTYRYLLDSMSDNGYIVVTTPYRLNFEYISICRGVLSKFDIVGAELGAKFGHLPVIGMGHSCGALLQTLIASEFNYTSRAANVLISFNNKPAKEAIPNFDDVVQPLSAQIMGTSNPSAASARDAIAAARSVFDGLLENVGASDVAPPVVKDELVPAVKQGLEVADQIPDILASIAAGTTEFTPTPEQTREIARAQYRVNRTFILQFENDAIDESPEIEGVLRKASEASSDQMQVELKQIGGTHVTPLTQNVFVDPPTLQLGGQFNFQTLEDPLTPLRAQVRENFLQTVNEVKTLIVQFLAQK